LSTPVQGTRVIWMSADQRIFGKDTHLRSATVHWHWPAQ